MDRYRGRPPEPQKGEVELNALGTNYRKGSENAGG